MSVSATIQHRIPFAETDQMGVVYYANYLIYFEMAREELLRMLNFSYTEMANSGYGMPVTEAVCRYRKPAKFEDIITIEARLEEMKGVRLKVGCTVRRGEEILAEGYTIHACLNTEGRPVKIPQRLIEACAGIGSRS